MITPLTLLVALLSVVPAGVKLEKGADGIVYSKHLAFRIPLNLTPQDRQKCKAIRLYVSMDEGKTWVRHSDGRPDMNLVTFRAHKDGSYWFTLSVVNPDDTQDPAEDEIGNVEPGLKVIVDTQAPDLSLKPVRNTSGKKGIRWEMNDENVDLLSFRIAIWKQGGGEWILQDIRHPENQLLWFEDGVEVQKIQATVSDRAGNTIVQQVDIYGDRFAKKTPEHFALDVSETQVAKSEEPSKPPIQRVAHSSPISDGKDLDSYSPLGDLKPAIPDEPMAPVQKPLPPTGMSAPPEVNRQVASQAPSTSPAPSPSPTPNASVLRSDSLVINYALDEGQANAVVELWGTQDDGKTWTMLAVDTDGRSPVEAKLSEQGVWGLLVRVPESPAQSGVAPTAGTKPDTYVDLDTEAPHVALEPATMTGNEVTIRWRATDRNLESQPVTILHSESALGPWTPIAQSIDNSGTFTWAAPNSDAMHYFRLEVKDRAGNVGKGVTRTSTRVASQTRSSSRVLGVQSGN